VALGEPFVILQDDCIPLAGWEPAAISARELLPDALIAFCLQAYVQQVSRSAFWRAMEQGPTLLQIRPQNWVPTLALGWTPELAARCLYWDEVQTELRENATADDGRLFHFQRGRLGEGIQTWVTVPSLVDHPDDVPSVDGGGSGTGKAKRRPLALYAGDPAEITWRLQPLG
jgi:hypothetical protein